IMTSNIGARFIIDAKIEKDGSLSRAAQEAVSGELRARFKPEFLNRIDDVITFKALTQSQIEQIIKLHIEMLNKRLTRQNIKVEVSKSTLDDLVIEGYDPVYGARPLRRVIDRKIENPLARAILSGEVKDGVFKI
ncbi:MAG: AAA family ATPase, partial [Opitutales bacterium]|nr:AAA family ATPase [Opitutales bacterium]